MVCATLNSVVNEVDMAKDEALFQELNGDGEEEVSDAATTPGCRESFFWRC